MRSLISIDDLSADELLQLRRYGSDIVQQKWSMHRPLAGRFIGSYFKVPSTRTRTSFAVAVAKLGGTLINYGPDDLQTTTGESLQDTAAMFNHFIDALVIRTNGPEDEMRVFRDAGKLGVINALSQNEHPTQAIADLITLEEHFKILDDLKILYLGEGNNTAASLMLALAATPRVDITIACPPGFGLPRQIALRAHELAKKHGSNFNEIDDPSLLPKGVDVIYTTRWASMGVEPHISNWREILHPYRVSRELFERVGKRGTVFLHDLPACREEEVTSEILDGPDSLVLRQSYHKLTSAMAVLGWLTE